MEESLSSAQINDLVSKVIAIEKRYAHELRNVDSERRSKIVELLNDYVVEGDSDSEAS